MDFSIHDLLSPASGSPSDMGVRPARTTAPSGSSGGRKEFSTVLHGIREDGRKTETRSVEDGRSPNKPDQKTRSTDTREQSASSTRGERTDGASSQARDVETNRSGDTGDGDTKTSETERIASTEHNSEGSGAQGRTSESLSPVMTPQAVAQAIAPTEVPAEEGDASTADVGALSAQPSQDPRSQAQGGFLTPRTDFSASTNTPQPTDASTKVPVLQDGEEDSQHDVPAQAPDAPTSGLKPGTVPDPVGKTTGSVTGEAATSEGTTRSDMRPSIPDSQRPVTHSQPVDVIGVPQAPILAKAAISGTTMESGKADVMAHESISFERMTSREVSQDEPVLRQHQDTGGRAIPAVSYGQGSGLQGDERFTGLFDDPQSQHRQPETKTAQQPTVITLPVTGEQAVESALAGAHGRMGASPPPPLSPPSAQSGGQLSPVVPTQSHAEQFVQGMTRAVVFNVAQPDLGQVNIRVALTNDVVHTHLSADRPEVGQFFINGQDRLQAAFQASGLDMGQFRVDIDRQGAGRSFHQGSSPEQGQTWNQGSQGQGTTWEQGLDQQEDRRTSLYGLLNVVA